MTGANKRPAVLRKVSASVLSWPLAIRLWTARTAVARPVGFPTKTPVLVLASTYSRTVLKGPGGVKDPAEPAAG